MILRTLLIGYGAMARAITAGVARSPQIRITHVIEKAPSCGRLQNELGESIQIASSVANVDGEIDCAVECAGQQAVREHVPALLRRGVEVILVSVGSLSEAGLVETLEAAARAGNARFLLVPGAIAGIDALAAAKEFGLEKVIYTGCKPPAGWKGTVAEQSLDVARIREPVTIFEGSAREAARLYPQNANVAAMVGLAGVGLDATRVKLIADPAVDRNVHRLHAEGAFGTLDTIVANRPLPHNPKTSALAACSVVRALRNRVAALVI